MALGTAVLGASTLGVGLLIGGTIFAFSGSKLSEKADEAYSQACRIRDDSEETCKRLKEIYDAGHQHASSLRRVNNIYLEYMAKMYDVVEKERKTNYDFFTKEEKDTLESTSMLVGLLYSMCKIELVKKSDSDKNIKFAVNSIALKESEENVCKVLSSIS